MVLCTKYGDGEKFVPDYKIAQPPKGVAPWAFQQIEYLKHYK
jgi:hypothetical protein